MNSEFADVVSRMYRVLKPADAETVDVSVCRRIAGVNPVFTAEEISRHYYPAMQLVAGRRAALEESRKRENRLYGSPAPKIPYVVSISGSVSSGKTTVTRLLSHILKSIDPALRTVHVSTDCFIMPTAELTRRDLMSRKGFPESYDWQAQMNFLKELRSGKREFSLPVYSHEVYDIVPGTRNEIRDPDIVLLEGLNLLQDHHDQDSLQPSDLTDFSIYLDMQEADLEKFFIRRIISLAHEGTGFYSSMKNMTDDELTARAVRVWTTINLPNLRQHIQPTRCRSDMIISLDSSHKVKSIRVRP